MHTELYPRIWVDDKLNSEVRSRLLAIAQKFLEFLKVDQEPVDVVFTGSLANYSYTSNSDLDLHVVLDFSKIAQDKELVTEYMMAKKGLWNERHHITVRGFPVELYAQDISEPHYATGVYSVLNDKWIRVPSSDETKVDERAIEKKASQITYEIDRAIESENLEKLNQISEKLGQLRKAGLEEHGESSPENLVFKTLRHDGTLRKLSDAKIELFDKQLTLSDTSSREASMFGRNRMLMADKDKLKNYDQTPKDRPNINKPSEVVPSYQGTLLNRQEEPDKFELELARRARKERRAEFRNGVWVEPKSYPSEWSEEDVKAFISSNLSKINQGSLKSVLREILFGKEMGLMNKSSINWDAVRKSIARNYPEFIRYRKPVPETNVEGRERD